MSVRALIRAQGSLQCLLAAAPPVAAYPIMQLKKTVEKFAPLKKATGRASDVYGSPGTVGPEV